jgi:hypothetical protein
MTVSSEAGARLAVLPAAWPTRLASQGWLAGQGRSWHAILISILIVAALLTLQFQLNHRYFYVDDRIAETVPKFVDIGRLLLSGQAPWLTTNIVNGSAYALEYLNGVYNPLNLALCVVFALARDVAFASFIYVLVHCCLLAGSAAWLGRTLGLNTLWAVTIGVSCGFQPYTIVWNASAWSQGLIAFAWLSLAVAALAAYHLRPARLHGWLILIATYGCLTSGWPHSVLILGLFAALLVLARLVMRLPLPSTIWICAWFGGGILCSLIAIVPLLTSFEVAARTSAVKNTVAFNVTPFEGLLQFANPGYYGFFNNWGGYALQPLPQFYAGWFLLPVLVFWKPAAFGRPTTALAAALIGMIGLSALAALGPERLLVLRFPTRALQFYQFFLVAFAALLVARGSFIFSRHRLWVLLGLVALLAVNAMQVDPDGAGRIALYGLAFAALCLAVWAPAGALAGQPTGASRSWYSPDVVVVLGTVALLACLAYNHPAGRGTDWGFPNKPGRLKPVSRSDYTLFFGNYLPPGADIGAYDEFRFATTGLGIGDRQINGYSSLGHRFFRKIFPIDDQGNFQPGAARRFTQLDTATGLQFLELFRVDQVIALLGPMDDAMRAAAGPKWQREATGRYTATYRHAAYPLPGGISYADPNLALSAPPDATCHNNNVTSCAVIDKAGAEPGLVVFARLWFPGYRAELNGEPLPVMRHAEMLPAVLIPPNRTGLLVLSYRPPGLRACGALALAVLGALAFASRRRTRTAAA